jgi:hypothetical protein
MLEDLKSQQRWPGRCARPRPIPSSSSAWKGQQSPEYLWIGCSDSRVPANEIVGLDPGELFVHRNVANLAPPQDANYLSVLQFAVDVIKVKHVMVVGHYGCGGVAAAIDGKRRGLVDHWLHPIREVHAEHKHELDALPEREGQAQPPVRAERHPPGAQRRLRRLRPGRLGARPAAVRAWVGSIRYEANGRAGATSGLSPERHEQTVAGGLG